MVIVAENGMVGERAKAEASWMVVMAGAAKVEPMEPEGRIVMLWQLRRVRAANAENGKRMSRTRGAAVRRKEPLKEIAKLAPKQSGWIIPEAVECIARSVLLNRFRTEIVTRRKIQFLRADVGNSTHLDWKPVF
jgi:hypothetical protein